jgi:hypothetical protein
MTGKGYPSDPMTAKWYAYEDDLIGGWSVMPVDEPPSEGCYVVASFITEATAYHIAELHNRWMEDQQP